MTKKNEINTELQLGYCCVSTLNPKLRCNRSSTKTYLEQHTKEECHKYLIEKARQNIDDLIHLLQANHRNQIEAYRMPEQILPQVDLGYYRTEELKEGLRQIGKVANEYGMQLSTHPSQYYVLNSLRSDVVEKSIHSIDLFSETLEYMELDNVPNLILHIGMKNGYDTVDQALEGFCKGYRRLSKAAQTYLVVENDHVSFTVENCLRLHEEIGVPVVFDNMHYKWNPGSMDYNECVKRSIETWKNRIPKFHLASDRDEKKHAHAEYVHLEDYLELAHAIEVNSIQKAYIMLECKEKDKAVIQLRHELEEKKQEYRKQENRKQEG